MGVAEDVAAVSAVVTPFKEAECSATDGRVADGGVRVRFPMRVSGRCDASGEVVGVH